MKTDTTKATADAAEGTLFLGDDWFDPLEAGVRTRIRSFIEELLEAELDVALGRDRDERPRLAETGVGGPAGCGGWPPARPSPARTDGNLRAGDGAGAPGAFGSAGRQDGRVEERDHSGLPAANQTGQRADRRRLFCRDQHASGPPGARGFVRRRRGEGHGQPGLAQGKGRLGRLEWPFARR